MLIFKLIISMVVFSPKNLKHEEAIPYFLKAIKINPDNYEVNNNLGIAYKVLKNQTQSEKYFNKAILIDNKNYKAFFNCANLYIDSSKISRCFRIS